MSACTSLTSNHGNHSKKAKITTYAHLHTRLHEKIVLTYNEMGTWGTIRIIEGNMDVLLHVGHNALQDNMNGDNDQQQRQQPHLREQQQRRRGLFQINEPARAPILAKVVPFKNNQR